MSNAFLGINNRTTPQTVRSRDDEVQNNEGGFVFQLTPRERLERFLVLGTTGGTFYATQQDITEENFEFLRDAIKQDEQTVLDTVYNVSVNGLAAKQSPTLFTFAMLFVYGEDKRALRTVFDKIIRTSTHLFEFAQYIDNLGGWGPAKRKAVAAWYTDKTPDQLAYQVTKYRNRWTWTHRDILRVSHPVGLDTTIGDFILHGVVKEDSPAQIRGFAEMQAAVSVEEVLTTLNTYPSLPWETIPTQFLTDAGVWKTLFYNKQLSGQALIRNVTRLAKIGAFDDWSFALDVSDAIVDTDMMARTRLHPINYLNAYMAYIYGSPRKSSYDDWEIEREMSWQMNGTIVTALHEGFHNSFKFVEPSNKRTVIGLDVSASMGSQANGINLSCSEVGVAMAMTIARKEPFYKIHGFSRQFVDLGISATTDLDSAISRTNRLTFGSTDCSLPIEWALQTGAEVDTFIVITDSETYAGRKKPYQALREYRQASGIPARLAVLGVASTGFTIAAKDDPGMADFVGFSADTPKAVAEFSRGF